MPFPKRSKAEPENASGQRRALPVNSIPSTPQFIDLSIKGTNGEDLHESVSLQVESLLDDVDILAVMGKKQQRCYMTTLRKKQYETVKDYEDSACTYCINKSLPCIRVQHVGGIKCAAVAPQPPALRRGDATDASFWVVPKVE